jgi:hypothetical protein
MSKLVERKLVALLAEQIAANPRYRVRPIKGIAEDIAARLADAFDVLGDEVVMKDARQGYLYADDGGRGGVDEWMSALRDSAPYYFDQEPDAAQVRSRSDLKTAAERAAWIGQHGEAAYLALPK